MKTLFNLRLYNGLYPGLLWILLLLVSQTVQAVPYDTLLVVAQDGSGGYTRIQDAIDDTKAFPDVRITILVKNGIYREKVTVFAWNTRLTLRGESPEKTIISWDDFFDKIDRGRNSTFHSWTLLVQGDDCRVENLTIENTAGPVGQAVALSVEADHCFVQNCRIRGHQDTLYTAGQNARQYYKNCYIEGTTDFIFGAATALFDSCTIHSLSNSFITAASTPTGREFGYVFRHCRLTAADGVDAVYLGRPWRDYAQTVFLYCDLGAQILPAGWNNWTVEREKTAFYAEFGNFGPGANTDRRVGWSRRLSKKQARKYTLQKILLPETWDAGMF
ncbi:MAG: pectin esterase [Lewinellaceae bacterium]|nr:pectin esterase [Lewinellaceae bacterium]